MRTTSLIAAAAILALAVTPVFGSGEEEGMASGPPTMQIYANYWDRNPNWSPETLVLAKFAEIAGAEIELVTGDAQKLKTLVASGDLPDTDVARLQSPGGHGLRHQGRAVRDRHPVRHDAQPELRGGRSTRSTTRP